MVSAKTGKFLNNLENCWPIVQIHENVWKFMENLRISTKRVPKVSQREPKGAKREPKGANSEPKGSEREPKGSHLEARGCQKWAKGRPKCIKKSIFVKGREKYEKREHPTLSAAPYLEPFPINNRWKNRRGNRCRKSEENGRKMMLKQTYILRFFGIALHEKSSFPKNVHVREP